MATEDALAREPAALTTTRIEPRRHTTGSRGVPDSVPASSMETGLFGRMFRNLPVFSHRPQSLVALAEKMVSEAEEAETPEGEVDPEETTRPIPAGYTYLGQFIDHDLTFDPVSMLDRQNDPNALNNFRTPRFDLDSMYGRGPADQPYLYVEAPWCTGPAFLLLGPEVSADPGAARTRSAAQRARHRARRRSAQRREPDRVPAPLGLPALSQRMMLRVAARRPTLGG